MVGLIDTPAIWAAKKRIIASQPHIETASWSIAHFNTDMKAPLKNCKINFLPIQGGIGDPSPDNVRPISGWTNLDIYIGSDNLFDPSQDVTEKYISAKGVIGGSAGTRYTQLIPVTAGETYAFTAIANKNSTGYKRVHGYNSSGTWVRQLGFVNIEEATRGRFTIHCSIPSGVAYVRVSYRTTDTEPIFVQCHKTEVAWGSTAGTIYGGYVDLVKGKLVEEIANVHAKDLPWANYSGYIIFYAQTTTRDTSYNVISDKLISAYGYDWSNKPNDSIISGISTRIYIRHNGVASIQEFMNWLNETDPIIVYKFDTPVEHQLTPQQLKSILGTNNIWSDANSETIVQYWTH